MISGGALQPLRAGILCYSGCERGDACVCVCMCRYMRVPAAGACAGCACACGGVRGAAAGGRGEQCLCVYGRGRPRLAVGLCPWVPVCGKPQPLAFPRQRRRLPVGTGGVAPRAGSVSARGAEPFPRTAQGCSRQHRAASPLHTLGYPRSSSPRPPPLGAEQPHGRGAGRHRRARILEVFSNKNRICL